MAPQQRHNVLRTLRGLVAKHVIYAKTNGSNRPLTWGLNNYMEEWDKSLFSVVHASMRGVAVFTNENAAGLTDDNTTILTGDNISVLRDDNTSVLAGDNTPVLTDDNSTVLMAENTTVITADDALYKRKSKEKSKEKSASHPALQENARTPSFARWATSKARPPPVT